MKRRDFVKTSLCLCCAGALGAGVPMMQNKNLLNQNDDDFIYKSVNDLPKRIRLDLCNMCQLHCVECYIRNNVDLINKQSCGFGYVPFEKYKALLDNNPNIKEIETSNHGEIFLNPDLEDIIRYSYEKGVKLTAFTGVNFNSVSERMAEALVKYKFRTMVLSIDGATPETYAIYRRGGDFNTVINNIKTVNKYKRKYNSIYPVLVYKFILFGHNIHEINKAKILANKLNMPIVFYPNYAQYYSPVPKDKQRKVQLATGVKPIGTDINHRFIQYKTSRSVPFFCTELYKDPQFTYNGDMFGCNKPFLQTYGVDLFRDGLLKTLNNEKVIYAKKMLADFSVEPRKDIMCSDCYVYEFLKEKNFNIKNDKLII